MAQDKSLTPEKELLKLIEKPASKGSSRASTMRHFGLSLFSLGALRGRFSFLKERFKDFKAQGIQGLNIKVLNMGLEFFTFILTAYFLFNLSTSIMTLRRPLDLRLNIERPAEVKSSPIMTSILKTATYYLEKARERDIFSREAKKIPDALKGPSQRIIEATAHLKLVGISWSADPDVMIEDTKTQRTLFLKKGQLIDSEIKVVAVFKDKVILSFKGEEIELR